MLIFLEILGGIVFFGFISFLSLILLPSIFGCFGFILFWCILFAILTVFSISFKWLLICALIVYSVLLINKYTRYNKLPDYDGYLYNNSNVYNDGKAVCKYCGSEHITNQGLFGNSSRSRYYMCLRCRNWLYRFRIV